MARMVSHDHIYVVSVQTGVLVSAVGISQSFFVILFGVMVGSQGVQPSRFGGHQDQVDLDLGFLSLPTSG